MPVSTLSRPIAEEITSQQAIAVHPACDKAGRLYYFIAQCARNIDTQRFEILVIAPNSSLAAINKALKTLNGGWFCTTWEASVTLVLSLL
jgi:hypothetical protein